MSKRSVKIILKNLDFVLDRQDKRGRIVAMIVARFQLKPANKNPAYIAALSVLQLSRSDCAGFLF